MKCLLYQFCIALLFNLVVQIISSLSYNYMKVFVVQFSSAGVDETFKIKLRTSLADNTEGVLVSVAEEYLRAHCPQHVDIEYFEFYNTKFERYEVLSPSAHLDASVKLFSVLAKTKSNEEKQLCIEGRAFDTSEGLFIDSRPLRIEEQVNRSEGTGLNTWDGSVVLAKYLEKHPQLVRGRRVLEVGSGTGVSGLAASFLGASLTVLTDLDYTLGNLRANVLLNYPPPSPGPGPGPASMKENEIARGDSQGSYDGSSSHDDSRPQVRPLDWTDATTYLLPSQCQQQGAGDGRGGGESGVLPGGAGPGAAGDVWDVILGADVVWLEQLVEPLATALRAHCSASTVILLAHQKRSEHTDSALFSYLQEFFMVTKVDAHELNPLFSSPKINIFECRLKEGIAV